ncbi:MAG: metallophosphoesterase family protein [Anaerolineae bacterium]|nr:metallophosphoesterase family protein [Anaerolineae bacterium]
MKIAVITDLHANLPALEAALDAIRRCGCDAIVHTGDAIAIGPYPAECLDLLLRTPDAWLIKGNHEAWFVDGLPSPRPAWLTEGEVAHQQWTHAQLDPALRAAVGQWPDQVERDIEGVRVAFLHYARDPEGRDLLPIVRERTPEALDRAFAGQRCQVLFYGHDHEPADVRGRARYVNPGALGCGREAVARYCVLTCRRGQFSVERHAVPYDDARLYRAFEQRRVPDRRTIYRLFYGGRYEAPHGDPGAGGG